MEPWLAKFDAGDSQAAWNLFADRYRRLILATIRRLVPDHDDVMDVFSTVCQALSADDFARLKRYSDRSVRPATVATWLVTVVRNLTVDWLRRRDGRHRHNVPATLSPLQQQIYAVVCIDGRSHVEAYELIQARHGSLMPFHEFLREVRTVGRAAPCPQSVPLRRGGTSESSIAEIAPPEVDPVEAAESVRRLAEVLGTQPPDLRLALELFVVERLPAAEVARAVGWPSPKTVYNRVYRALTALRIQLELKGIGPGDL